jgi:multiple sugar transport system permease protein
MSTTTPVRERRSVLRRLGDPTTLLVVAVFCLAPFYWMSSLRRTQDAFDMSPLPSPLSTENYRAVFQSDNGFLRALGNSVIVAGVTTVLTLIVGIFAAYALARLNFRFKRFVLALVISTSMFPGSLLVVPLLRLFTDIGWINTYQAMVVPNLSFALPLAVWNLTAFFRQLQFELEQSAMVDGCTPGQAFRRIILPLAAPGVFTTAIITFVVAWNEYMIAVSMINEKSMKTANVIVSQFTGQHGFDQPFGTQMAAGVIVTVPLVVVVLIFQRRIVAGLTSGGLK